MHPRSIYSKREPNFVQLAEKYESFRSFVKKESNGRGYINFKDPEAVKQLCLVLLKHDFGLDVDFPTNSLCPTVPNRLNYILWLEDLLRETLPRSSADKAIGIDVGVGASCIYPLLGCAANEHWTFLGTEINPLSMTYATKNVTSNNLQNRITLKHNPDPSKIFLLDENIQYTFSMCNPPFFSSQEEVNQGLLTKALEPFAVCQGSAHEMITEGGELEFISTMVRESVVLQKQVRWYTSMIGLKRTIRPLVRFVKDLGIDNFLVTQFIQGKTTRWAIAWSFFPERPKHIFAIETWKPKYEFEVELPKPIQFVESHVKQILEDLDISFDHSQDDHESDFDCIAHENTWSRAARRQRKRQKVSQDTSCSVEKLKNENPFTCKLICSKHGISLEESSYFQIVWTNGGDRATFEAFWAHLKKRVEEACGLDRGTSFTKK